MRPLTRVVALGIALTAMYTTHAQTEPTVADRDVGPPDVYQAVRLVHFELAALRHVTGKSAVEDPATFVVVSAAPRHVFYQAQVLFRKTHQLAGEIAGDRQLPLDEVGADWRRATPRPVPDNREIVPADVLQVVADTGDRIKAALLLLKYTVSIQSPLERDATKQPADVFAEIVRVKRQLNRMMERPFQMRDVFERVRVSINYAGDIGADYFPQTVAEEARAVDVYRRLIACLRLIRQLGTVRGVETLVWEESGELDSDDVMPADVYDLATTVVAEIDYLARHVGAQPTSPPRGEYRAPREVLPEHALALVGVLEAQLRFLAEPNTAADAPVQ